MATINDRDVIDRILCYLKLWEQGVRALPARALPTIAEWGIGLFGGHAVCLPAP